MLHMNPIMHENRSHLRDDLHRFDLRDADNRTVELSDHLRRDIGLEPSRAGLDPAPRPARRRWRIALRSPIYLRAVAQ